MTQTTASPGATSTTDDVKDKASEAAGQAQQKAQEAAGQAKSQIHQQVGERSTQAGEQLAGHASDIRAVSEGLRDQGKEQPAKLAEQAADRAERLSGYLKDSDPDQLLHDLEDLGRRQPWAVVLGGLAVGFAASRFLKASSSERYQASSGNGSGDLSQYRRPSQPERATPLTPALGTGAPPGTGVGGPAGL